MAVRWATTGQRRCDGGPGRRPRGLVRSTLCHDRGCATVRSGMVAARGRGVQRRGRARPGPLGRRRPAGLPAAALLPRRPDGPAEPRPVPGAAGSRHPRHARIHVAGPTAPTRPAGATRVRRAAYAACLLVPRRYPGRAHPGRDRRGCAPAHAARAVGAGMERSGPRGAPVARRAGPARRPELPQPDARYPRPGVDFDKCGFRTGDAWKCDNLERLLRSLRKELRLDPGFRWSEKDWTDFLAGYRPDAAA